MEMLNYYFDPNHPLKEFFVDNEYLQSNFIISTSSKNENGNENDQIKTTSIISSIKIETEMSNLDLGFICYLLQNQKIKIDEIQEIEIKNNKFDYEINNFNLLCQSIQKANFTQLKSLSFQNNQINDNMLQILFTALSSSFPIIQSINLGSNEISNLSCFASPSSLFENDKRIELSLSQELLLQQQRAFDLSNHKINDVTTFSKIMMPMSTELNLEANDKVSDITQLATYLNFDQLNNLRLDSHHIPCFSDEHSLELLIKSCTDIHKCDNYDRTLVWIACEKENEKCLELLIKYGADLNKFNKYGQSPCCLRKKEMTNV